MSADGQMMVTPDEDAEATALYDFTYGLAKPAPTGHSPIATGMMPDGNSFFFFFLLVKITYCSPHRSHLTGIVGNRAQGAPSHCSSS